MEKIDKGRSQNEKSATPFVMQTGENVGSLTFGKIQSPEGEVMKLHLVNVQPEQNRPTQPEFSSQLFGTHIREAIAIVKDWKNRP